MWTVAVLNVALLITFVNQLVDRLPYPFLNLCSIFWLHDLSFFDSVHEVQLDYLVLRSLHKNELILVYVLWSNLKMGFFISFSQRSLQRVFPLINFALRKHHVSYPVVPISPLLVEYTEKNLIQRRVEDDAAISRYARGVRVPALVVKSFKVLCIRL